MSMHSIPHSVEYANFHINDKELYIPVNFENASIVDRLDGRYDIV